MARLILAAPLFVAPCTLLLILSGCTAQGAEPSLVLSVTPAPLDALGRTARVRVVATEADETIGQGVVTLSASPGVLDETELTLDSFGRFSQR